MAKLTMDSLAALDKTSRSVGTNYIKVGMSTCGVAAGADEAFSAFVEEAGKRNLSMKILKCGCIGACYAEPLVEVAVEGMPTVLYGKVNRDAAIKILDKHVFQKIVVQDLVFDGILRR